MEHLANMFCKEFFPQSRILLRAKCNWIEWKCRSHTSIHPPITSSTNTPIHSYYKTTWLLGWRLLAVAVYVLQDWKGSFINVDTRFVEQASILVAEVMTLRDEMKAALEAQIQYLQVEGDNQIVIHTFKGIVHIQ